MTLVLDDTLSKISVVIVNDHVEGQVARAVDSVLCQHCVTEIIIVDNWFGSPRPMMLRDQHPAVQLIESDSSVGFAAATNLGAQTASGELFFFLNPDATTGPGCITTSSQFTEPVQELLVLPYIQQHVPPRTLTLR